MMDLAQEIEDALDRFALEQEITREEVLAVIARDWLIGQGYLRATKMRSMLAMKRGQWSEPVTFETQRHGQYRTIASAEEAAGVLIGQWPREDGKALRKACKACLDLLKGLATLKPREGLF